MLWILCILPLNSKENQYTLTVLSLIFHYVEKTPEVPKKIKAYLRFPYPNDYR